MQVKVNEVSPVLFDIEVLLPWTDVSLAREQAFKRLAPKAAVKGFRPGKAPLQLVKKLYAGQVSAQVNQDLIDKSLTETMRERSINVVSAPVLQRIEAPEGAPLEYSVRVEVLPRMTDFNYAGLSAKLEDVSVTDEEVAQRLEALRSDAGEYVGTEEGHLVQSGDRVIASIKLWQGASADMSNAAPDKTIDELPIEVGAGKLPEHLETALIGKRASETVVVEEREDQGERKFEVVIRSVQRLELPELDDDFAKDTSDKETLEALRDKLREDMLQERKDAAAMAYRKAILDAFVGLNPVEVPPSLVERQKQAALKSGAGFNKAIELFKAHQESGEAGEFDFKRVMEETGAEEAKLAVQKAVIFSALTDKLSISASQEEIDQLVAQEAEREGKHPAAVRARYAQEKDGQDALESQIITDKILRHLCDQAQLELPANVRF